jgi:hypothetical protein
MKTDIIELESAQAQTPPNVLQTATSWELAQRVAKAFAQSSLVPQQYQGNVANVLVALEMANRIGASPLMVMQNLYIVHGNPGWSSKFLIACFNQGGKYTSLRYEWNADRTQCRAWTIEKSTDERLEGPAVTMQMAKDEGWSTKSGSKWKTMPELMLMYRAAAFLIRTYAPEITMGLPTEDELVDIQPPAPAVGTGIDAVRAVLAAPRPVDVDDNADAFALFCKRIDEAEGESEAADIVTEGVNALPEAFKTKLIQHYETAWPDGEPA